MKRVLYYCCGSLAALALFAIMGLTFVDVGGRKFLSQSIPGALELTEMLMVVVIFAALPMVSERGEHVVFDSLDPIWPSWFLKLLKALIHLLCAVALLGLAYVLWQAGEGFAQSGDVSARLHIARAPFVYGMGLMCALTAGVHLALLPSAFGTAANSTSEEHSSGVAL